MATSRTTKSGSFKRRSAMKILHTTVDTFAVPTNVAAGGVLAYTSIVRQLSAKYGRNMAQQCTFRVVGLRATLVNVADAVADIGGALAIQAQYVSPSRHRVAAVERILREYVQDVRDDSAWSKGRQLLVGLDTVQPPDAAESVLMRNDVVSRMAYLGASAAGVVGIFADYNAQHVQKPGLGGLNQPDQDLYTDQASQVMDSITGHAVLYGAWDDDTGAGWAGAWGITGRYNGAMACHDWEWWAPAGTYLPVMGGMVKWIASDSWYPVLQGGTDTTITAGVQYDPLTPTRGSATVILQTFVEGWTPVSSK